MNTLYPLKFQPLFHYRIWGGDKLRTVLNKDYSENNIGESWEISTVPGNESVVSKGSLKGNTINELIKEYGADFLGENVLERFGTDFPLLIKFIDAKTPLSIQVHPDDVLAKKRHNSFGKNEMWYVMGADKDAELIIGFNKLLDKKSYKASIEKGDIEEALNKVKVLEGDTFFIPAGRVHAIGAGVMIAEIQQTSDVTYRIFDFNRVDEKTGATRELHTEQSVDAIDFNLIDNYKTVYSLSEANNKLVHTRYFKTNILNIQGNISLTVSKKESFKILICIEGDVDILYQNKMEMLNRGETILLPASLDYKVLISATNAKILEVYI
ncbi:mannose-6-phosphate isomerase [Formosa agariphila KMM 3901]|uniref:Phosphohexomutase n=1 Tax=Formosa agariphila (strain DSM 15362 / KCTC 12365 / LMG 23005 / KMM 3901 / M-2Alg 35-1) TaxID=1347342 RepID=T2KQT0_FORAG|nr:type I phosphomannose isomerase catalytic subunit [Formosa agariphila]CDF80796.1 mannose-6-phosphate isomerase [Formosa agariphila KMM 3901]